MAGKNGTVTRILTSIAFIALGLGFAVDAVSNLISLQFETILGINSVLGILMFVLGIMGVSKASMKACRIVAVIVCILAVTSFVITVFTFNWSSILNAVTTTFVWALLAWIYFDVT